MCPDDFRLSRKWHNSNSNIGGEKFVGGTTKSEIFYGEILLTILISGVVRIECYYSYGFSGWISKQRISFNFSNDPANIDLDKNGITREVWRGRNGLLFIRSLLFGKKNSFARNGIIRKFYLQSLCTLCRWLRQHSLSFDKKEKFSRWEWNYVITMRRKAWSNIFLFKI